jgi:phosphoenolpyruvate carboxylase
VEKAKNKKKKKQQQRLTMDDGSSELVDILLEIERDQSTSYARKIHTFFLLFSMGHLAHKQTHNNLQNLAHGCMMMVTGTIQEVDQQRIRKEMDGGQKLHVECVASCPMHVSRLPHRSPHHHSSCCCVKQLKQICDETRCRPD